MLGFLLGSLDAGENAPPRWRPSNGTADSMETKIGESRRSGIRAAGMLSENRSAVQSEPSRNTCNNFYSPSEA